jgi:hypothetical protein
VGVLKCLWILERTWQVQPRSQISESYDSESDDYDRNITQDVDDDEEEEEETD